MTIGNRTTRNSRGPWELFGAIHQTLPRARSHKSVTVIVKSLVAHRAERNGLSRIFFSSRL